MTDVFAWQASSLVDVSVLSLTYRALYKFLALLDFLEFYILHVSDQTNFNISFEMMLSFIEEEKLSKPNLALC